MKIAIVDTYYRTFLEYFYKTHPEVHTASYQTHKECLMKMRFAASDAYSYFLRKEGCEADEIVVNDGRLQRKWAQENGMAGSPLPDLFADGTNFLFGKDWRFKVLKKQIQKMQPDVILIKEQTILTDQMIQELRADARLVAIQISSPLLKRRG